VIFAYLIVEGVTSRNTSIGLRLGTVRVGAFGAFAYVLSAQRRSHAGVNR
jgi:hypothetical protein